MCQGEVRSEIEGNLSSRICAYRSGFASHLMLRAASSALILDAPALTDSILCSACRLRIHLVSSWKILVWESFRMVLIEFCLPS